MDTSAMLLELDRLRDAINDAETEADEEALLREYARLKESVAQAERGFLN